MWTSFMPNSRKEKDRFWPYQTSTAYHPAAGYKRSGSSSIFKWEISKSPCYTGVYSFIFNILGRSATTFIFKNRQSCTSFNLSMGETKLNSKMGEINFFIYVFYILTSKQLYDFRAIRCCKMYLQTFKQYFILYCFFVAIYCLSKCPSGMHLKKVLHILYILVHICTKLTSYSDRSQLWQRD